VSGDKSVGRSAQDDVFVVSWRCKKKRLLGFLLSAEQVSAYGAQPLRTLLLRGRKDCGQEQELLVHGVKAFEKKPFSAHVSGFPAPGTTNTRVGGSH
jgi:hypothetical protein